MVNTRKSASNEEVTDETVPIFCDDPELQRMLGSLSDESRSLAQVITRIMSAKMDEKFNTLQAALSQIIQITRELILAKPSTLNVATQAK